MTIEEFLLARIAEDEARAQVEAILRDGDPYYDDPGEAGAYERHFVPARVLAQCAALRAVVAANPVGVRYAPEPMAAGATMRTGFVFGQEIVWWTVPDEPNETLLALARIWQGHADFDPAWAPS